MTHQTMLLSASWVSVSLYSDGLKLQQAPVMNTDLSYVIRKKKESETRDCLSTDSFFQKCEKCATF